jgi:hypothetical protein
VFQFELLARYCFVDTSTVLVDFVLQSNCSENQDRVLYYAIEKAIGSRSILEPMAKKHYEDYRTSSLKSS